MEQRNLGTLDLKVSALGLGTNNFAYRSDVDPMPVVARALDLGVTLFDTAEAYGEGRSEEALGKALGARRRDVVIATKWGGGGAIGRPGTGTRAYIFAAVERSLRHLDTDYIDLYQYHVPDPTTPWEETLSACTDLVQQGKVRHVGLSNASAQQIVEAQRAARDIGLKLVTLQEGYNLVRRDQIEGDLEEVLDTYEMGLLPWAPLESGLLTGKYDRSQAAPEGSRFSVLPSFRDRYTNDRNWSLMHAYKDFAAREGRDLLTLALSWLVSRPAVTSVIAGATSPAQLDRNLAGLTWKLDPGQLAAIDAIYSGTVAEAE